VNRVDTGKSPIFANAFVAHFFFDLFNSLRLLSGNATVGMDFADVISYCGQRYTGIADVSAFGVVTSAS